MHRVDRVTTSGKALEGSRGHLQGLQVRMRIYRFKK